MNVIINLWDFIKGSDFKKYFVEVKFCNSNRSFDAIMPFIILTKNREEADNINIQITNELREKHFGTYELNITELFTEEGLNFKENELLRKLTELNQEDIGTTAFEFHILERTLDSIPILLDLGDLKDEKIKPPYTKCINFPIIKNLDTSINRKGKIVLNPNEEFILIIKLPQPTP